MSKSKNRTSWTKKFPIQYGIYGFALAIALNLGAIACGMRKTLTVKPQAKSQAQTVLGLPGAEVLAVDYRADQDGNCDGDNLGSCYLQLDVPLSDDGAAVTYKSFLCENNDASSCTEYLTISCGQHFTNCAGQYAGALAGNSVDGGLLMVDQGAVEGTYRVTAIDRLSNASLFILGPSSSPQANIQVRAFR